MHNHKQTSPTLLLENVIFLYKSDGFAIKRLTTVNQLLACKFEHFWRCKFTEHIKKIVTNKVVYNHIAQGSVGTNIILIQAISVPTKKFV